MQPIPRNREMIDWNLLEQFGKPGSIASWVVMIIVVCVAVWLIYRLRAWFGEDSDRAGDGLEMLSQFGDLRRQGELTDDEYRLIKSRLAKDVAAQTRGSSPVKPTLAELAGRKSQPLKQGVEDNASNNEDGTESDRSSPAENPPTKEVANRQQDSDFAPTPEGSGNGAP